MASNRISFMNEIITSNKVYALKVDNGYAMALSNIYVDEDDNRIELFCFWSNRKLATDSIVGEWYNYQVVDIELSIFLEHWCIGISNENYAIGIDFKEDGVGNEFDSLELLIEICKSLIQQKVDLQFEKFKSVNELLSYAEQALNYDN